MKSVLRFLVLLCLGALAVACKPAGERTSELPSTFDFYVLALSWSPGYCESEGANADRGQCASGRAYDFVLHGLWPQYVRGYPSDCRSDHGGGVAGDLVRSMLDIMPAPGLIRHEWQKHGTCSTLDQMTYFETARAAHDRVKTPPSFDGLRETKTVSPESVEKLFQAANPGLPADAIAVTCKRQYLRDVRICLTKDLASFVSCPEVDANRCTRSSVAVPPVR